MTPRFSVILPVYNAAATLARAIESVLAQSWPAHEIIVVDDGSTDHSASVAQGFGAAITLLRQPNAGVSAARNAGAGPWRVAFVVHAEPWTNHGRYGRCRPDRCGCAPG